jgi:hypothetical protein
VARADLQTNIGVTTIASQKSEQQHRSLAAKVQNSYVGFMQRLSIVLESVSKSVPWIIFIGSNRHVVISGVQQGKQILDMTARIM